MKSPAHRRLSLPQVIIAAPSLHPFVFFFFVATDKRYQIAPTGRLYCKITFASLSSWISYASISPSSVSFRRGWPRFRLWANFFPPPLVAPFPDRRARLPPFDRCNRFPSSFPERHSFLSCRNDPPQRGISFSETDYSTPRIGLLFLSVAPPLRGSPCANFLARPATPFFRAFSNHLSLLFLGKNF